MKKFPLILFTLLLIIGSGCKKSNGSTVNDTSTEITPVNNSLISGLWKVTYFIRNGSNRTAEFAQYKFTFNKSGLLTGANDMLAQNGNWSLTDRT